MKLDRILDNYYTKKLLEEVKWSFIVRDLDYKYKIGLIDLNLGLEAILCAYI